jgi:chromosomal replication initiator protein
MAANVYPADREIDRAALIDANREFLRALSRAYPDTARELAQKAKRASTQQGEPALLVKLPTIENHLERLIDKVTRATDVFDSDIALMTAKAPPNKAHRIIQECARKHNVTVVEMLSIRRKKGLVVARQEAMYRLYAETSFSLPQIGAALGGRDHTTALHGVRAHAERNGLPPLVKPKASA